MNKQQVYDAVNWDAVMRAPRYAGGHEEVMRAMYEGRAEVIDHWVMNDYQGELAIAWRFPDGSVAVLTDYFGSCSGCDAWENATDDEARTMVKSLASSARVFPSVNEAAEFCRTASDDAANFPFRAARNLDLSGNLDARQRCTSPVEYYDED